MNTEVVSDLTLQPDSTLHPISALELAHVDDAPTLGETPHLEWVSPTSLLVDEHYQRKLSRKSVKLIRTIVENFSWCRLKPPIVVKTSTGLHVIDGQHTAIASATIGLEEIPVFVVDAPTVPDRARAFVGHNTDRVIVSPIDVFHALLAAGDAEALTVDAVCRRAKVTVRHLSQSSAIGPGDTMAVISIRKVIARQGELRAQRILEVLNGAGCMPIGSAELLAVEHILCNTRGIPPAKQLTDIIRSDGPSGIRAARGEASSTRVPLWRVLVTRWSSRLPQSAAA